MTTFSLRPEVGAESPSNRLLSKLAGRPTDSGFSTRIATSSFRASWPVRKVPWEFQSQRPDTDHFNRDFKPELARGGTEICRLDPQDGTVTRLTHTDPPVWDFRASESPDGRRFVFCRAETGGVPAICRMDSDGARPRVLTRGIDNEGADPPRWGS